MRPIDGWQRPGHSGCSVRARAPVGAGHPSPMSPLDPPTSCRSAWASGRRRRVLSAVELELFTQLGAEAMTGEELGERLGLHPRAISDFLDALVALRLPRARRRRARRPLPQHRRDRGVPRQAEPGLHRRHPRDGERAALSVLGRPHRGAADRQAAERGQAHRHADVRGALQRPGAARAVHGRDGGHLGRQLPARSPRSSTSRATRRSATSAARPASSARSVAAAPPAPALHDLRPAGRRADRRAARSRPPAWPTASTAASGDFFADPLPQADVITMGMILHDWNLEKKMHLIRAAYEALPAGRRVHRDREPDRRRAPRERLRPDDVAQHADRVRRRLRLHRRATSPAGAGRSGFREVEIMPLAGPASAGIAYK